MIDVKLLLRDLEGVSAKLATKKVDANSINELAILAREYRSKKSSCEELQALNNKSSKQYGEIKKNGADDPTLKATLEGYKRELKILEDEIRALEVSLNEKLLSVPNLPDDRTPIGEDENDNVVLEKILEPKNFDFKPLHHYELAEKNGWIDFLGGVRLAKSRFNVLRGEGARLNRALINFMLDVNESRGFEVAVVPVLANRESMIATGQLPKFANDVFKVASNDLEEMSDSKYLEELGISENKKGVELYLISTSEISLTNLYRDCIVDYESLPIKLTASTPCFRKEAGSASRDTRGIIRQHQFDKCELVAITDNETSYKMQDFMIETASLILQKLELPHRMVQLCSGDLGFSAANTVDIEVYLPAQGVYREISSISNCTDFQARRGAIRYKKDGKNILAHTLNGSSLAVGRTLVAVMENYQNIDGTISIPDVLKKYL